MIKTLQKISLILLLLAAGGLTAGAQTDKRLAEIKRIYEETNLKIAESNENGEYSSVFLTELVVNKNNGSYPAVGLYQTIAKFYYTYGDREKNPYPNRLLKIELETRRSADTEKYEYLFDEAGRLIFYFESRADAELRVYFAAEKPLKFLKGEQTLELTDKAANLTAKNALAEKRKLVGIFSNSLEF